MTMDMLAVILNLTLRETHVGCLNFKWEKSAGTSNVHNGQSFDTISTESYSTSNSQADRRLASLGAGYSRLLWQR